MKLAIGGDHAGFALKSPVIDFLRGQGHEVVDFGTIVPHRLISQILPGLSVTLW